MKAVARESGNRKKYCHKEIVDEFSRAFGSHRRKLSCNLSNFCIFFFRKMERLRLLLADRDFFKGGTFLDFEPLPFLLDPEILIKGIVAEK